jgi:hypothetical protein
MKIILIKNYLEITRYRTTFVSFFFYEKKLREHFGKHSDQIVKKEADYQ